MMMAEMMTLKEASEYLKLSENQVRVLVEAHELRGRQEGEEWRIDRISAISFKARQQAESNSVQSIEDERKPGGDDDVLLPVDPDA
jgi:excisionase family DNA binding protein